MTLIRNTLVAGEMQDPLRAVIAARAALNQARVSLDAAERDEDEAIMDADFEQARARITAAANREAEALRAAQAVKGDMLAVIAHKADMALAAGPHSVQGEKLGRQVLEEIVALALRSGVLA